MGIRWVDSEGLKRAFRFLLISLAGYLNQNQRNLIDYLQEKNRVLREQIDLKRLHLDDDQRRRLAVMVKKLGRRQLNVLTTLVTFAPKEAGSAIIFLRRAAPSYSIRKMPAESSLTLQYSYRILYPSTFSTYRYQICLRLEIC